MFQLKTNRQSVFDDNGNYNLLLSKLSKKMIIFAQWFCTSSFAFTSALFRKIFVSTEALV
jgi:hypothetical protein